MRRTRVLACVLVVAAAGGCGGSHKVSDRQQITQTLQSYLRAQAAGDGITACTLLTSGAQQQLITLVVKAANGAITAPSCEEAVGLVRGAAGAQLMAALAGARIEAVEVRGGRATARVVDGTQFPPQQVTLEKAGTTWKISGVPSLGG